jgi:hypothetical protein
MWIKTKDGRLHDVTGCTIEPLVETKTFATGQEKYSRVQIVPRQGKPIVVADELSDEKREHLMAFIENSIAAGRLLTVEAIASFAGKERVLSFLVRLRWSEWDGPLFTILGVAVGLAQLFYRYVWKDPKK